MLLVLDIIDKKIGQFGYHLVVVTVFINVIEELCRVCTSFEFLLKYVIGDHLSLMIRIK